MTGVIYLQKNKFDIYATPPGKVSEFLFVPEIIKELEIINQDLLESLVKLFVTGNNIPACNLVVIIADDACFIKDFISSSQPSEPGPKEQAAQFIENVPFEKVTGRTFPLQGGVKAFAVNEDFYMGINKAFEKMGFKVMGVYPAFVFNKTIGANFVLSPVNSTLLSTQIGSLTSFNILTPEVPLVEKEVTGEEEAGTSEEVIIKDEKPQGPKNNKRLYLLIGLFVFLLIVLVIVYFSVN